MQRDDERTVYEDETVRKEQRPIRVVEGRG